VRYEVYKTFWRREWRWRFIANGRVIAESSEGYKNYIDCLRSVDVMRGSRNAPEHSTN